MRKAREAQAKAREQAQQQQQQGGGGMPDFGAGGPGAGGGPNMSQFSQFLNDPELLTAFQVRLIGMFQG